MAVLNSHDTSKAMTRQGQWFGHACGCSAVLSQRRCTSSARLLVLSLLLVLFIGSTVIQTARAADPKSPSAEQLKAAFLLNFPKYVDWPSSNSVNASRPVVIGLMADEKMIAVTEAMVNEKKSTGPPIVIKHINTAQDADGCHILFIGSGRQQTLKDILPSLGGKGILTVGEDSGFLDEGGIINLDLRDRKIGLQVNLAAANAAGLNISSRLLSVATVVKGKRD